MRAFHPRQRLIRLLSALVIAICPLSGGNLVHAGATPPGRWAFRSYGSEQGLTNLSMWTLEQDRDGFLWVGTESGLFRYDGNKFQRFSVKDGLPADMVRIVYSARSRDLWLGTLQGVAVRRGNNIRALGREAGLNTSEIFAFAEDPQQRIWVGADHGVFRQKPGGLSFEALPGWPAEATARALCLDGQTMYVASWNHLFAYDLPACKPPREVLGPWTERIDALAKDGSGRLWIRTRSQLWMRPAEATSFQDMSDHVKGTAFFDGALRGTPDGGLLIPLAEGLARVKGDHWDFVGEAQGLPTPWVNRALVDREGSLWVCGTGLHRGLGRESWRLYTQKDGVPGSVVQSMFKDREGRFWIGTALGMCQGGPKTWKLVPETRGVAVLAILQTSDGAIWMAGGPPWVLRWDPVRNTWLNFKDLGSTVTHMVQDPQTGDLLLATRRKGLWRVVRRGDGYSTEPIELPDGARDERFFGVFQGSGGRIWAPGSLGLALREGGHWKRFKPGDGLESLQVMALLERRNGDIWMSYLNTPGLFRYAMEGGRLVRKEMLNGHSGLSSEQIHHIREDALGRLWAGTSLGANMIEGRVVHPFGTGEGLPGDDCNANAFFAEPNGDVWVGTLGGLANFRSSTYQGLPTPPPAQILSARFGATLLAGSQAGSIRIPYRDAAPEFRFAGMSFLNESRVMHQIRLLGYEKEWRNTDIRQANFTNLPPGDYRFEVRAGYGNGTWGAPVGLDFKVIPAWWQTWWLRTLAALGLAGLIAAIVWLRLKTLHEKNLVLDRLVNKRTRELAEANNTLRQLTVTDPLTGLKNRRYLDLTIEEDLAKVRRDHHSVLRRQEKRMAVNIDLVFFMVDLDHFKDVNDTYGHSVGDSVLRQLKDRLLGAVRDTDTVVRWGGEEFLVVAKGTDRAQGSIQAERILSLIRNKPFDIGGGQTIRKTCSLGFAPYPCVEDNPEAVTWQQVVDLADRCLYSAKKSGRDGWVGIRDCKSEPVTVGAFLEAPLTVIGERGWDLATSFPEIAKLEW